ncbi:MAG TPA: DUF5658 family protein [Armatimonadota bacterium]|nr:DUF5658 family protein [Armatimonadota bacterium]
MIDRDSHEHRYFWSGWFNGQSFAELAAVFAMLSFVDLLATLRMMSVGVREGNGLANSFYQAYGPAGMVVFKVALVAVVLLATGVVDKTNPRLARGVLWGGNLLMAVLTFIHLAIISGMATGMVFG